MKLEHKHFVINAIVDRATREISREEAQQFIDLLLNRINMKPLGQLNFANAEDLEFPGQSFVQMITTSHCSLHLFVNEDSDNEIYFDLYSCKEFDEQKIIEMLDAKFVIKRYNGLIYYRSTTNISRVQQIS